MKFVLAALVTAGTVLAVMFALNQTQFGRTIVGRAVNG